MKARKKVLLAVVSTCLIGSTFYATFRKRTRRDINGTYRKLRMFDPNHNMCSDREEAHVYAVGCMFGVENEEHYLQNTVSTDSVLSYTQTDEIEKILQALAHVARKTGRAIRIKMPVYPGYNSEHKQPYSLVDAGYLSDLGIPIVEPQFWTKAHGPRGHLPVMEHVDLGENPLGKLSNITNWGNEDADELVFSFDELTHIDATSLGKLVGEKGGYANGKWSRPFMCQGIPGHKSHIEVIPYRNDPPLFSSGNYFLYPS